MTLPTHTVATGRASIITFYVLAAACLSLPYLNPSPMVGLVRWVAFSTVSAIWLLANYRWWTRLTIRPWICVCLVSIVTWDLISASWSEDPAYTLARAISFMLLFVLSFVFTARVVRERNEGVLLNLVALHALALFLPGLILWGLKIMVVPWTGMPLILNHRYAGMLWNANQVAATGVVMFPLAFALWWQSKFRVWILAILAVIGMSIFLSQSRAGLLSFFVGLAVFFAVRYRMKWVFPAAILAGFALALIYHASDKVQSGVARFIVRKESAVIEEVNIAEAGANRFMVWKPIWDEIKKRPVRGAGFATGGTEIGDKHIMAHNSYLQIAQETGFVGLAIFLPTLLALLYILFKISILDAPLPDRALWAGIAAAVAAGLVDAFFESWLFSLGNPGALPFWLCAFLLLSRIEKRKKKARNRA